MFLSCLLLPLILICPGLSHLVHYPSQSRASNQSHLLPLVTLPSLIPSDFPSMAHPSPCRRYLPLAVLLLLLGCFRRQAGAQLYDNFYANSCPNLENIVRRTVAASLVTVPTAPAALLRLVFHDCQVQGCDASIMLDSANGITSELVSKANFGIRRLEIIDRIKAAVEQACPQTVSCADIIVLAGRDAVNIAGGPNFGVPLGRRDSTTASNLLADSQLPPADVSLDKFFQIFGSMGMNDEESVAILGAHTLGVGHCVNVVNRLYPSRDRNLGFFFGNFLRLSCPPRYSDRTVLPNDLTSLIFDSQYFSNSLNGRGLFTIDSEVASNPSTAAVMQRFAGNPTEFFQAFSSAYVKLSLKGVLTGNQGQVRRNCRRVN